MPDHIGRRMKRLRQEQHLTLKALADKSGVALSSIAAVEIGTRSGLNLTAHTCMRLAKALGISINELLAPDDDEPAYELVEVDGLMVRQYLLPVGNGA